METELELIDALFPESRREYSGGKLLESEIDNNPYILFKDWLQQAFKSSNPEPNAFCLASINNNRPFSRMLLLKAWYKYDPVFFTNYNSAKGEQLKNNSSASMLFFWPELMRQVRIEGQVHKLSDALNDSYFATRPDNAKVGAHASRQSQELLTRELLDREYQEVKQKFIGKSICRPDHWGGYFLKPDYYEFWQGRESRLHDRIRYERKDSAWIISRLYP